MDWKIIAYVSVGPLSFGMTSAEVATRLGPPEDVKVDALGPGAPQKSGAAPRELVIEYRLGATGWESKPTVFYKEGKLTSVDIYPELAGVEIDGRRIFQRPKQSFIEDMISRSSRYAESEEWYVFLDHGLAISKDPTWDDTESINAFARGDSDGIIADGVRDGSFKIVVKEADHLPP